ncbi:MAG: hydroxymethylbilane synthase [Chlamydiae bacterium]|nr:hydroxymethylbilane synthase [Chlamydiota bacterium]
MVKRDPIRCGARSSLLSQAQVKEVQGELPFPIEPVWVETIGDRDQITSLKHLGKTDFFTRELDSLLLGGSIRMAVHSAKDLPDPLPKGLYLAALTKEKDPRDSLVFLRPLTDTPRVATSSLRREEGVRLLYPAATFLDVRGSIHDRLKWLQTDQADGVVIAEAALIRLELTQLPRVFLPGETPEGQGKLAIVIREEDHELRDLLEIIYDPISRTRPEPMEER